ncbi:hypothetical protein M9Y10_029150 [Tritrichomonas musculus]|uniref:Uncharacterized protein n=1 Tax=Tritrichomonas musculus TaxID=1915356 RepID=A0ABR2KLT2_9EUKA
MFVEQDDYKLPIYIFNDICMLLTGKSINEHFQSANYDDINFPLELYSISSKEFQNKGAMAKARYFGGSNQRFTNSQNTTSQKKSKNNIKTNRLQQNCYYGPAFSMEKGNNLCFFNQALQVILHCKSIYE